MVPFYSAPVVSFYSALDTRFNAQPNEGTCSPAGDSNGTERVVYIIDDDARVGEALSTLLRANGKNVRIFTSGRDFLDFKHKDSCACLILDLKMPELNGLEVQELISADTTIP
jgi:PleD family two-component response regulator